MQTSIKAATNHNSHLETVLREQRSGNEKLVKEVSKLMISRTDLQTELANINRQISERDKALEDKSNEYKLSIQENKR